MKTASEILEDAATLIENGGWTQGAYVRNAEGLPSDWINPSAQYFCAHAALVFAARGGAPKMRDEAYDAVFEQLESLILDRTIVLSLDDFERWNDSPERTQKEVVRMFRKAVERSQQTENGQ